MKKRLLFAAALTIALFLPSRKADALRKDDCFQENYGSGQCGTTCVYYNDQGSVMGWGTTFYAC